MTRKPAGTVALVSTNKLTEEQRARLVAALKKARLSAEYRIQFAALAQLRQLRRLELREACRASQPDSAPSPLH
jgi:hypothetical protein